MHIESALFFETPSQIYSRVFRNFCPSNAAVPEVQVRFCKYANANSRIRLLDGMLRVKISDVLEQAPAPVQEALAFILISKLFRTRVDDKFSACYRRYLSRPDVRESIEAVKKKRGRKQFRRADIGKFNLVEIFDRLNQKHFGGLLSRPSLGWSLRLSRTTLGHYDHCHHMIVISGLLDQHHRTSQEIVEFVMFHEMLHLKIPTVQCGTRRCIHSKEFRAAERAFPDYSKIQAQMRRLLREIDQTTVERTV